MSDSPVFSRRDADRILQRVAEIDGSEDGRALSLDDVRGIAGEAGFARAAVERAIAEALERGPGEARRTPIEKRGWLRIQIWTLRTIPVELSSDQLLRAVRLFQPYRDGPPRVSLEEGQLTWRDRSGLIFHLHSSGGDTEIRVRIAKVALLRRQRLLGWVRSAADRLEALVTMVAARDLSVSSLLAAGDSDVSRRP